MFTEGDTIFFEGEYLNKDYQRYVNSNKFWNDKNYTGNNENSELVEREFQFHIRKEKSKKENTKRIIFQDMAKIILMMARFLKDILKVMK